MSDTHIFAFWQEPPEITKNSKSSIWVERNDFYLKTDMIGPNQHGWT